MNRSKTLTFFLVLLVAMTGFGCVHTPTPVEPQQPEKPAEVTTTEAKPIEVKPAAVKPKPAKPKKKALIKFDHKSGHTLAVKGADIYYEIQGKADGKPLLLLHGGLGSMTDLNGFVGKLPTKYRMIAIDFRGHGKSTMGTAPLTYAQHQEDVEAVLTKLGITNVSILGVDDGGTVGYRMAASSPVKVRQLITLGSHWRLLPDDMALPILRSLTAKKWSKLFPESVAYYTKINPQPNFDALEKAVVGLWTNVQPTGYPGESVCAIKAPVLIARGDDDHLFSLEEAAELRNRIAESGFLNIPYAGHAAYEAAPEVFISAVNAFLEVKESTQ
ncbi:alpha/beta fold hydrolase [Pseudodesulfovibrio sediminis]|uniref:AB hydrolase-1 domain-containing protein n=1 Tax=Pseudodesulfovibrio sediminis TaxID=2810563 RepID=A0ABM7P7B8_9BACT|nr:alpha/beta hydrolase [Pseudodesulfovibrio sediminis]BCS89248.1 hypothetical protein PSDVSF_24900 [Pseudodesulfovibrio sediminis]